MIFLTMLNQLLKHSLVGKPEDIAQEVLLLHRKYIDIGIDQFFLAFQDPFGRSVRSKYDWAITYILDAAFGYFIACSKQMV